MVVSTRSGRGATKRVEIPVEDEEEPVDEEIELETPARTPSRVATPSPVSSSEGPSKRVVVDRESERQVEPTRVYKPTAPYPGRLLQNKIDHQYDKFIELIKQLKVNLPFIEILQSMPKYVKFLKNIMANKIKLEELSQVSLSEECSAILQNKLPVKMDDPSSFIIPCSIGDLSIKNAVADLGASVNLMPYSIFKQLDLGELKPTHMYIQLANKSTKFPRGIIENLLVKVDKFVFHVDFVVLDMPEDDAVPLILGCPFLATSRVVVDMGEGKLSISVGEEQVEFVIKPRMRGDLLDELQAIDDHLDHELEKLIPKETESRRRKGKEKETVSAVNWWLNLPGRYRNRKELKRKEEVLKVYDFWGGSYCKEKPPNARVIDA